MDYSKINYFEKIEKKSQADYVNSHNHCLLCSTVLELRHVRLAEGPEDHHHIKEEAHCPQCDLKARAKIFTLQ